MNDSRQQTRRTASWMAILALAAISGCHVAHPLKVKEAPCPPPVYMEYPYFGYHPTCWARWPADWIGCPPEECMPIFEGPGAEMLPLPEGTPFPPPTTPLVDEADALPPAPPSLPETDLPPTVPDADSPPLLPRAPLLPERGASPEVPPAADATPDDATPGDAAPEAAAPKSSQMQLRLPARPTHEDARLRSPRRTSLSTYTSSPRVADSQPEPRRVYGMIRMARRAAVRRSDGLYPTPPSIQELVGAETDDRFQFDGTEGAAAAFPTASAGY